MKPVNSRRIVESALGLFVVSLTVRAIFLWLVAQNFTSDEYWFKFSDTVFFADVAQSFRDGFALHEESLALVGPGYGFVLFIQDLFAGSNVWANLIINILVSSLNCLLVRSLALRVGVSKTTAALAGYICALSISSISFSCILYSETVFTLITLLTVHSFLSTVAQGRLSDGLAFASLCAIASLIRSVGQFYPLMLALLLALWIWHERNNAGLPDIPLRSARLFMYVTLAAALTIIWPLRNYAVHGVFTISETGTRAARDYWIAEAVADIHGDTSLEIPRVLWKKQIASRYGPTGPTILQRHEFDLNIIRDTVSAYPLETFSAYLGNVWTNMTSESYVQHENVPQLDELWTFYSKRFASNLGVVLVMLHFLGSYLMIRGGLWRAATLLALFYLYLALITGASFWQGSRLFLPAQPFWAISCAFALFWILEKSKGLLRHLRSRWLPAD
ncbi:MAG: hypothetical protein IH914_09425 [candidate division Zixibacteria bacterium]|nr:hypothetical protein [candidate division Zixibacteria bacterium]